MSRQRFDKSWWNKQRVKNGLLRFIRDIAKNDSEKLPKSVTEYNDLIPKEDKCRKLKLKLYPPPASVSKHFGTMAAAWWECGYLVEVKVHEPKWPLTPEIEAMLRKIYSYDFRKKDRPKDIPGGAKEYAKQIGYPGDAMTKFAIELGLARCKEKPWSIEEIKLLDKNGYLSVSRLQLLFSQNGFTRSKTAILLMRKRRMAHKSGGYFSASALAVLLGVDNHCVLNWLDKGWLKFIRKGTGKQRPQQGGDTHLIHRNWLYQFICEHPEEIDLRKVDQIWFLNIVTKGRVQFVKSTRLRKRHEASTLEKPIEFRKGTKKGPTPKTFFLVRWHCPCPRTNVVPDVVTRTFKRPLCDRCGRKAYLKQIREEQEKAA